MELVSYLLRDVLVKCDFEQDFAFELECDAFRWRWETCLLGHKSSAELISKHLICESSIYPKCKAP